MSPEKLPNYLYMIREQAEARIGSTIGYQNPFLWILITICIQMI